jgi:hypothetical protein
MTEVQELLAAHPAFERTLRQFMMLYDAAEVLGELKPPHGDTAAEFLREVGNHIMRDAGMPDDFVQAMIAARPPADPGHPVTTA